MVETAVEIARCEACSAEVRDDSLFCYNCGASVSSPELPPPPPLEVEPALAAPGKPETRPPLRSASSLRKQRRAFNRQPVKITWEQPEGSPKAFVVTTIVLALGAAILLAVALYLR